MVMANLLDLGHGKKHGYFFMRSSGRLASSGLAYVCTSSLVWSVFVGSVDASLVVAASAVLSLSMSRTELPQLSCPFEVVVLGMAWLQAVVLGMAPRLEEILGTVLCLAVVLGVVFILEEYLGSSA